MDGEHQVYYQGRWWDAPITDGAIRLDPEDRGKCVLCQEEMIKDDDVLIMPYMIAHLECHLRSIMGDVEHLEGRCICSGYKGETHQEENYRKSAKQTLDWMIAHNRGRFRNGH